MSAHEPNTYIAGLMFRKVKKWKHTFLEEGRTLIDAITLPWDFVRRAH